MGRLKTREQLERERIETERYALGTVTLDTTKLLLIYARQSTSRQYVTNIYSAMEQRDGLLERASLLGWKLDEQWILYIENQLAKKTQVSGSLRIDQRPGLQALTEVIESGRASAVLVVSVDRITRDPDLITPTQFANLCKKYNVLIITDDYIFDFNNPNRDDMGRFMNEAIASKEYVRKQIKGKMLKNRDRKANMGRVANGVAPVGLMLDPNMLDEKGKPYQLVPTVHAGRVDWLYARFRALDANLSALFWEVVNMAKQGKPIFPDSDEIDPRIMRLRKVPGGWTIASKNTLRYILSNPMYQGHLVFNDRIVKWNAHPAIVNASNWQYAFDHLADVDLDGNPIEREKRTARYSQQGNTNTALLAGTRDNGKPTITGVNGAHVYVHTPTRAYVIQGHGTLTTYQLGARIAIDILDRTIEERVLYWARRYERVCERICCEEAPHLAMKAIEETAQPIAGTVQDDLTLSKQELARVQATLNKYQDSMADSRLQQYLEKEKRLIKRVAELERAQAEKERIEQEQKQASSDIEQANDKWAKWNLEKRRQFIRLVTESITLEEIADGWLRLSIVWSPIMGFIHPLTSSEWAIDTAYIWRQAGSHWSAEDKDKLKMFYPNASRVDLLHMFPSRSWQSIVGKAGTLKIRRKAPPDAVDLPEYMSLTDRRVIEEFAVKPGMGVQWQHTHLTNEYYSS